MSDIPVSFIVIEPSRRRTDEIRAAAERLRKFVSGEVQTYDDERYRSDLLLIRDAYLAEHPADDSQVELKEKVK